MIHKLTYEKPQSDVVRLQAPTLLVNGSGGTEGFDTPTTGKWSDDDLLFNPGGLPGLSMEDLL